ncbi:MAG: hypothetical protein ACOY4H_01025 [Thermodesulfobacteriota bacterium]
MTPKQLSLFDQPTLGGVVRDVKTAMNEAVKKSALSREQVRDKMNQLSRRHRVNLNGGNAKELSKDVFEKWLNVEDEVRIPSIKALTIFCAALSSQEPLAAMVKPLGFMVIADNDIKLLELAKYQQKVKAARRKIRQLEDELG